MSFRWDVLIKVNGFDPFYTINAGEDLDIGYRLVRAGYQLLYSPEAVVFHQHSDNEDRLKNIQYNGKIGATLPNNVTVFIIGCFMQALCSG